MSAKATCSVHSVQVLKQTAATGASMGVKRTYAVDRVLSCRMVAQSASKNVQLGQSAQDIVHEMWTTESPQLTERDRIAWKGTVMRIIGIPRDAHGQGRIWQTLCVTKTEDNAVPVEIV